VFVNVKLSRNLRSKRKGGGLASKSGKLVAQNLFMGISSFGAANAAAGFVHKGGFAGTGS
jgi:hypothetical protein